MNILRNVKLYNGFDIIFALLICNSCTVSPTPQQPEINDQYENTTQIDEIITPNVTNEQAEVIKNVTANNTVKIHAKIVANEESIAMKVYRTITTPIVRIISIPKVKSVIRNIGTCIVNGAMDLITYYLPPPLIPLIASAAGTIIPFEPVVMLRQKMPVASYKRAFRTALEGFLGTFDRYKLEDEDDPYMTRRFNRRLMDHSSENDKIKN